MKKSINFSMFCDAFNDAGRGDSFSYEGKRALFDYLESYEQDIGEELELDVVALCCDFNEDSIDNIASDYRIDVEGLDEDDKQAAVLDYLSDNTTVIDVNGDTVIYQVF